MRVAADSAVRRLALEPARSAIVQAPAGSGKTELLIQRYLRLLSHVSEPEQILAITFTRKAAAEMRSRVLDALELAAGPDTELPDHRRTTRELAEQALRRDRELGWKLLEDPNRIAIKTLDSFNADLAMHMPLQSGAIAGADIVDDAAALYAEAARRAVQAVWQSDAAPPGTLEVFAELDYSVTRTEDLLAALLSVREQWLHWLFDIDAAMTETQSALAQLRARNAEEIERLVDSDLRRRLETVTRHANQHGNESTKARTSGIDSADPAARWRAVAAMVLRQTDGGWRTRVDKRDGFGPEHKLQKQACLDLLEELGQHAELRSALAAAAVLPSESPDVEEQAFMEAVATLLRLAVAELQVLFARRSSADFTELALNARQALGLVDSPSELLLALDRRLQHILVDEFQDTSQAQVELLELLTEGWEPGDGRSLFLVGDPMQSIYRFRNADMSLFIGARRFGIGNVQLEALNLSANFRSAPAIVDWVNDVFSTCFPPEDDPAGGVAAFHRSHAARVNDVDDSVNCVAVSSTDLADEHAAVLQVLLAERARHPQSSIAILVRSRAHLAGFQALLREHGWQARAVEIDAPHTSQLAQDLIAMARALTHFGDRLAWLALLRAPWCGLTWHELETLVGDDARVTVWEVMHDATRLASLDEDSCRRLTGLRSKLEYALRRRGRLPFIQWIYQTWCDVGGPQALLEDHEVTELDTLLSILDQAASDQDVADVAELESFFTRPVKQSDQSSSDIEIMTIHRAKGLEFDCVIVPGLARKPRSDNRRLIEWSSLIDADGQRRRIVAPMRKSATETAAWIRRREADHAIQEAARLMYVAATRARSRLHLLWGLDADTRPPAGSLLAPLWEVLEHTPLTVVARRDTTIERRVLPLRRLRAALPPRLPEESAATAADQSGGAENAYNWTADTAVNVGIVVHDWLQAICETGCEGWNAAAVESHGTALQRHLELLGVPSAELEQATAQACRALIGVLEDPRGRWIIGAREEARSEIMLSSVADNRVVHQRLDRTFVDDGCRWIIDYKTAAYEGGNVEAFLDQEVERYRAQLESYAAAMAELDSRPIRLGLYFPMLPAFRDWAPPVHGAGG